MRLASSLTLSLASAALLFGLAAAAQANTFVDLPGLNVQTGAGGTSVNMPGLDVQTGYGADDSAGTTVMIPAEPTRGYAPAPRRIATSGASYVNADLVGMDFHDQNLMGADFTNATLSNTDFSGANLSGAVFQNADLTNTNFAGAILVDANFTNASLIGTNLTNADLSRANLTNATIEGALATGTRFDGAILTNVDMSNFIRVGVAAPRPRPVSVQMGGQRPMLIEAGAIRQALTIDPRNPKAPKRVDLTVNFDFNSDKLTNDGLRQVTEIANALKDSSLQGMHIMVEGHTDSVGSDAYNQKLSYRRATRVQNTLVNEFGIASALLSARGFGETQPLTSNESDLGRATNRRVTLVNTGR